MFDNSRRAFIAINDNAEVCLIPKMANRHGLITGATGTGKTVTLQTLSETFSEMGVPVFAADMKGDLSGVAKIGGNKESVAKRAVQYNLQEKGFEYKAFPVRFWDVFAEQGHPIRTTVTSMGPLLLERLLDLNETQGAILSMAFRIADDNNLLLIDLKDLQKMLQYIGDNRAQFTTKYGNISPASIGAIQRGLVRLENEGADKFFGEPDLEITDFIQTEQGKGVINILAADKLMRSPRVYTTFLLWLLDDLYETLPEVGDLEKPKLVFFFDEAHLLFNDMPAPLLEKVEQIVRLIRSKGVGVYFCTQNPADIPQSILGQLGNRVQHALRAYTPNDQKAVRVAANTFRANPAFDTGEAITQLNTGEALVSFLDEKGAPQMVERANILPPQGQIGPITEGERDQLIRSSLVYGVYEKLIDRESAFEILSEKEELLEEERRLATEEKERIRQQKEAQKATLEAERAKRAAARQRKEDQGFLGEILTQVGKSTQRQISNQLGRTITRSIFGALFGKK
ncbi:helicase HerA-like domain-containing protein [Proteiniphilum sp.]|uniref:helicase HerA-like domain-containing protein n=1 Tax=Proteiniphilum sp. TaxID=1926877 RepID=UPI002B205ED9|nr:helicase HerA-like domain-containing protein [Proteiniphilum sp.]MEA4917473.1 helicase HerA-like domain-containing protein [Proteiniphilum sp.]